MRTSLLVILTLLVRVAAGQGLEIGAFVSHVPTISYQADGLSTPEYARNSLFAGAAVTAELSRRFGACLQASYGLSTLSEFVSDDGVESIDHSLVSWLIEVPLEYQVLTTGRLTLRTGASIGWVQVIDRYSYRLRVRDNAGVSIADFSDSVPKAGITAAPQVELRVALTSSLGVSWSTSVRYARARIPAVEPIVEVEGNTARIVREGRIGRTIRHDGVQTTVGLLYRLR